MKKFVGMIDVEPTWEVLCIEVQKGVLKADMLLPACRIADVVRQAQKQNKKNIIFTFEEGKISIDEDVGVEVVELEEY